MAELKLQYADGFDETKSMSTTGQFSVVLTSDGISYDLNQATDIAIKVGNAEGYVSDIPVDLNAIDDKAQGTVNIKLDDNFMAQFPPDVYYIEVWVGTDKGRIIFPSSGVLPFTIDNNIMSNVNGVAKITMYAFQNNFNDLKKMIMNNQAFLDTKLRQELEEQTQIKNDFANTVDTKQKNFDTDLANARQNIEDKKNDAHNYVDKINSDSTNDMQNKITNSKNYIDNKTKETNDYIDNTASNNTNAINQTASDSKKDLVNYASDRQSDVNNTVNNAKTDLQNFSSARQSEINGRINELKSTITNQQNQYQSNIDNMNKDVNNHKASYDNLHDETVSLLHQLEQNEGKVHASVDDVNSLRQASKDDAHSMQKNIDEAHDQAVQQSSSYTDKAKQDLIDKNKVLSSKVEDYQKSNIALSIDDWNELNDSGIYHSLGTIHLEANKQYCIAIDYMTKENWENGPDRTVLLNGLPDDMTNFNNGASGGRAMGYNPNSGNWLYDLHPRIKYVPKNDMDLNLSIVRWGSTSQYFAYKNLNITQTSNFIPYNVSQQNKASIESEGQFTDDYQAPNLVDGSSEMTGLFNPLRSDDWSGDITSVNLEAGKKYWVSAVISSKSIGTSFAIASFPHSNNIQDRKRDYVFPQLSNAYSEDVTNDTKLKKFSFIAPTTQTYYINYAVVSKNNNDSYFSKLTVTQSDEYVPFEVAQRNKLWNDRITNKTNDLSDKINSTFDYALIDRGTLNDGDNIDNIKQTGKYYLAGGNYKGMPSDASDNTWGFLIIYNSSKYDDDNIQEFIDYNLGIKWYRHCNSSNKDKWNRIATQQDLKDKSNDLSNKIDNMKNFDNGLTINKQNVYVQNNQLMFNNKPLLTATAPNAPQLKLGTDKSNNYLQYTIIPSNVIGGAEITSYEIYWKKQSDNNWQSRQIDKDNLYGELPAEKSSTYNVKVTATNYAGTSQDSEIYNVISANVPEIHTLDFNIDYPNGMTYSYNFNDNGATINSYKFYYKKSNDSEWIGQLTDKSSGKINCDINTYYDIKVVAQNAVGSSQEYTKTKLYYNNTNLDYILNVTGKYVSYTTSSFSGVELSSKFNKWQELYPDVKQLGLYYYQTQFMNGVNYSTNTPVNTTAPSAEYVRTNGTKSIYPVSDTVNNTVYKSDTRSWYCHGSGSMFFVVMYVEGLKADGSSTGLWTTLRIV